MSTLNVDKVDPSTGTALELGTSGDTVTVPTGAGLTVTDEVKTNKISPATGTAFALGDSGDTFTVPSGATIVNSGTATGFGGGKILQVTQGTSASQTIHSTTSTYTASAITGTITPSSTDSKVFVQCWFLTRIALNPSTVAGGGLKLYKDVGGAGFAALWPASGGIETYSIGGASGEINKRSFQTISYLDSPSTTSAITYTIYAAQGGTGYGNITTSSDSSSASVIMFEIDGS